MKSAPHIYSGFSCIESLCHKETERWIEENRREKRDREIYVRKRVYICTMIQVRNEKRDRKKKFASCLHRRVKWKGHSVRAGLYRRQMKGGAEEASWYEAGRE